MENNKKRAALICGSFDPITLGHLDIIRRASSLFDTVYVTAFVNPEKSYCFSEEQRLSFMKTACADIQNVICDSNSGMVCDYVKSKGIDCIVKGIRNEKDLAYEAEMADFNRRCSGRETLFFVSSKELENCSSTLVRSSLENGDDLTPLLPASILSKVKTAFRRKTDN